MALVLAQLIAVAPKELDLANKKDQFGWAPLHILANGGNQSAARAGMIRTLCSAKADINVTKNRGTTPLHVAAATSQLLQAEALALNGADPNRANDEGSTPLDQSWNNKGMQDLLLNLAAGKGEGYTGRGRQLFICIYIYILMFFCFCFSLLCEMFCTLLIFVVVVLGCCLWCGDFAM